jgi:LysR family carnitine catabolism transcriptional activator
MSLTIRRLRTFITVAQLQNFRRAAEELASSQPALTAHIKDLEQFLGVALFNRTTRRVTLTREGEILLARAKRSLIEIDAVVDELKHRAAVQRGRIIVGCTPSIAMSLLPLALTDFRRRYPTIDVQIYDEASEVLERRLLSGEIDFAVGPPPLRPNGLTFRHLFHDPFMAICPLGHPVSKSDKVRLKELSDFPLIMMRRGMRTEIESAFAAQGCQLRPAIEVFHHYTLMGLVEAGMGLGILPRMTVLILRRRKIRTLTISPEITRDFGVTMRQGETVSAASTQFIDSLRKTLQRAIP